VFEGQFFSEFSRARHVCTPRELPASYLRFGAMDYGFDMLAVLWIAVSPSGEFFVYRELCRPNLTLSEAAREVAQRCAGERISYLVASPDLWNRRQDSGFSGEEIMAREAGLPPLLRADDRRIVGWRALREYLHADEEAHARLQIFSCCPTLIRSMESLLFDRHRTEDAASEPHAVTHAPEALRYAVMSRAESLCEVSVWESTERGVRNFLRD
jgi:phage terminase large subunit